ncbi:MAG: methylmalonyl Co-A mutase-associated GTPase MeaB [Deltaproteobacteria bacterium]|nr:methylmalonyl Co-A mutase-associated GTPase MeaB [Deltaproteobacteria bacterium]
MENTKKIREGSVRTASRLIRNIEDRHPEARAAIKKIFPHTGGAHIIGITGSAGAGKSTLVDGLISAFRKKNQTVGVLAIDPTSPFSGGALLGDRIRMQKHAEDQGVFVRSLATRGAMGGLSKAAGDAIHILDAMGKDIILVETVGTGQQEVDIMHNSHTVIVVLVPGMGDEIQAIKAGIMEIADIFVVNKADHAGTAQLIRELKNMLDMAHIPDDGWRPPVLTVGSAFETASFVENLNILSEKIADHHQYLIHFNELKNRLRRKTRVEIRDALRSCILDPVLADLDARGELDRLTELLINKESDPYTAAEEIASRYLRKIPIKQTKKGGIVR